MYELVKTIGNTYYIDCPAKVGIYVDGTDAWLIDGGSDKDAGRRVLKTVHEQGWEVKAIINTHAHADHYGGDRFIYDRTGCDIYASGINSIVERIPIIEPTVLFGGWPPNAMRNKFLMGTPVNSLEITEAEMPEGMKYINLSGHSPSMIGIKTPDDVWFIADTLSSPHTLEKYHVAYTFDFEDYLKSLDTVESLEGAYFIPSHAEPGEDMSELVAINRAKCLEVIDTVRSACNEPSDIDTVIKKVFDRYGLTLTLQQYMLVGSTIKSCMTYLLYRGEVGTVISDNRLLWKTTEAE